MSVNPLINPQTIVIPHRPCTCPKTTHKMPVSLARSKALRNCRLIHTENIDSIDAAFQPYPDKIDEKIGEYRNMMFLGHRSPRYGHACEKFEWWRERRGMWEEERAERCVKAKGGFYGHWHGEKFEVSGIP